MKTFTIGWLNKCRCGNKSHTVKTARGNETALWDDDAVKCNSCGRGGVIQVYEGQARVLWETDEEMAENKPMITITKEFTKEQLQQIEAAAKEVLWPVVWSEKKAREHFSEKITPKVVLKLARIALASLEAEAVCVIDQSNLDYLNSGSDADVWPASRTEMGDVLLYRSAPPAPVSVPDENGLFPCPFCGGRPEEDAGGCSEYDGHEHQDYSINCKSCGAEVYCAVGSFEKADIPCSCHHSAREVCVEKWNRRAAMLQGADGKPELTVWYGAMPETNGKTNWTAILHRKGECISTGITIDRSEYPDRVRYEADRMRYLIGEISEKPDILAYDADAHSGYVKTGNSPVIPDGLNIRAVAALREAVRNQWLKSDDFADRVYWKSMHDIANEIVSAMLAAAPQQEVK